MKKDKFILSYENINNICSKLLKNKSGIVVYIEKSPNKNSNSFYLRFKDKNTSTSLRLSDHHTLLTKNDAGIRNLIITNSTTNGEVINKINEALTALKYKSNIIRIDTLYSKIKKEK